MKRSSWLFVLLSGVVLGSLACGLLLWRGQSFDLGSLLSSKKTEVSNLLLLREEIKQSNKLVTAIYLYTAVGDLKDSNNLGAIGLPNIDLPGTEAIYLFSFDGTFTAGYDVSEVDVITSDENIITIVLPKAEIIGREHGNLTPVYSNYNILNPLRLGEESSEVEAKKTEMEKRAIEIGLLKNAEEYAEVSFRKTFATFLNADWEILFEFKAPERNPVE